MAVPIRQRQMRRLSAACFMAFLALAVITRFGLIAEKPLLRVLVRPEGTGLAALMKALSEFGTIRGAMLVTAPAVLLLSYRRRYREVVLVFASFWISFMTPVAKLIIGRPRPSSSLLGFSAPHLDSAAYPSGHAALAASVYGMLILLTVVRIRSRPLKMVLAFGLGGLALLVGISRVVIGVHFPTDVAGGILLGVAWVSLVGSLGES